MNNLENKNELETNVIIKSIPNELRENECKNIKWTRTCPKCNREVILCRRPYGKEKENKRICMGCYSTRNKFKENGKIEIIDGIKYWIKLCSKCSCKIKYLSQSNLHRSLKKNTNCEQCQYKNMRIYSKDVALKIDRQRKYFLLWLRGDSNHFEEFIGLSLNEFKIWISIQFNDTMTWNNRGYRTCHIDHKRPMSSFNLKNVEEVYKAWNFKNLQPLTASENLAKGRKWIIQ